MILNFLLAILFVGMIIYHGYFFVRYRRPYRIAFIIFWGLLLGSHLARNEDLYPIIALSLVIAIIWQKREPAAIRKIMMMETAKRSKPSSPILGVWDKDLDGP